MKTSTVVLLMLTTLLPRAAGAQQPATGAVVTLPSLQQAAIDTDPRLQQRQWLRQQSDLRLENIAAGRLPAISIDGQAQYQTDVPQAPIAAPGGGPLFAAAKATYDGSVRIEQRLFDSTIGAQAALERAQLAEQQARVDTTLFALRQQVNEAFFTAAAMQERAGALAASVAELQARLDETNVRVREGAALPADSAAIEAALLQRRQDEDELRASRRAALARLSTLTGRPLAETDTLQVNDVTALVTAARQTRDTTRRRPEYVQFARSRDRLARQRDVAAAQERPRVSTYARVGYGLPGLNFIDDRFESYGVAGVRLQWNAWTWGIAGRERGALMLQQQIVDADEAAFARGLVAAVESDEESFDRLQRAVSGDERIVALRQQVVGATRLRFQEGVVTASEYLDRQTELLQAQFARATHRVELAHTGARLLTTLGLEVQ
jgi:outer membrane protein TolC